MLQRQWFSLHYLIKRSEILFLMQVTLNLADVACNPSPDWSQRTNSISRQPHCCLGGHQLITSSQCIYAVLQRHLSMSRHNNNVGSSRITIASIDVDTCKLVGCVYGIEIRSCVRPATRFERICNLCSGRRDSGEASVIGDRNATFKDGGLIIQGPNPSGIKPL